MRTAVFIAWSIVSSIAAAAPIPGHHLPEGAEQTVRERMVDIRSLAADLTVDMRRQEIQGFVTVTFTPLRSGLETVQFDAANPVVSKVTLLGGSRPRELVFSQSDRMLSFELPSATAPGDEVAVRIDYRAQPDSGLYFFPETKRDAAEAWNYGEGGRHYGWLPLYNDTNDRFSVDFRITVGKPYTVLGNGTLVETTDNDNGTRTFHWVQDEPIPNYLLALDVGRFVNVPLRAADLGGREVPLTVWTHPGAEASAKFSFGRTPDMIEFFSERYGVDFAWDKYDQATLRNFSGAMETTTMVGFAPYSLTEQGGPQDNGPELELAYPSWTTEDTIAHELAHHWFGDLLTCRSVASIWLNESFASFSHTLWNGYAHGEDDLTYQRWRYLDLYLDFVRDTGIVRPLEYYRYDASDDMYTMEITYLKGSLVLHMLRHFLGDKNFFPAIAAYIERHRFSEVDSEDFQRALEDATGRKLDWFFEDWIRGGGGHPSLEVSYQWSPERKALDLTIDQVQADMEFENLFDVPVDVEIVTKNGQSTRTLRLHERSLHAAIPVDGEPLLVTVDKGNWLVADIHQQASIDELAFAVDQGDVAAGLRAARELAEDYSRDPDASAVLAKLLTDGKRHWGLRQEAALDLGTIGTPEAASALLAGLGDKDRRIRRAIVVALGRVGGTRSGQVLEKVIADDTSEEVVGAAAVALGVIHAPQAKNVLIGLLDREARFYDIFRLAALQGLSELGDPALAKMFARYVGPEFNQGIRLQAIAGWSNSAPQDPALAKMLRALASDPDYTIQGSALDTLGQLHHADDIAFLDDFAETAADPNLQVAAHDAAEAIRAFTE